MIAEYTSYARYLAGRYRTPPESREDFEQVAYLELIKAVDGFDPNLGYAFLSFATPTIVGEIKRHFRDATWAVHVPRRMQELSAEVRAATESFGQRHGRSPTLDEMARLLRVDREDVVCAIGAGDVYMTLSLDMPSTTEDGGGPPLGDLIGADDDSLRTVVDRETLRPLLARLSRRDKQILLLRYFRGMSQDQIGREIGVSRMQVSRLLTGILGQLRQDVCKPPAPPRVGPPTPSTRSEGRPPIAVR